MPDGAGDTPEWDQGLGSVVGVDDTVEVPGLVPDLDLLLGPIGVVPLDCRRLTSAPMPLALSAGRIATRPVAAIIGSALLCTSLWLTSASSATAANSQAAATCSTNQVAVAAEVCVAKGDPPATKVLATIRALQAQYSLKSVIFGVWEGGTQVLSGALGNSYPGVPASRAMHFRIGNVTETFETTLLLQLVDRGKIRLDDPVSKWLPSLPNADKVTVGMLANSTAGYASFYTNAWTAAFQADPFRPWTPNELISISTSQPMDFAPGTNWTFSDSNFVILGQVLEKAGGEPVPQQIQTLILNPLGLHNTQMTPTSYIPSPVLHAYDPERGDYQDSTFWSISWAPNNGDMTSDLTDLGRWAKTMGTGALLSAQSRARQFAPGTVGLGPFTSSKLYYGFGGIVANTWKFAEPGLIGYTGTVAYLPAQKISVVIFTTANPDAPAGGQYALSIFNHVAPILAPASPPDLPSALTHLPG
jgi:D-alanyl-D-alanine carboxypeptidase